jgi:thiamine biosynthesis lipoprotein
MQNFKLLLLFLLFLACNQPPKKFEFIKIAGKTQGTTYHITYENKINKDLTPEFEARLKKFSKIFSIYDSSSVITKLNNNKVSTVNEPMFEDMYNKSLAIYKKSNGAFDITVGPLVRAWGFGPDNKKMPSKKGVDSLLKLVGMEKISFQNNVFSKSDPRIKIDINGIAQGYSVDMIAKYLDSLEIQNYLVEIGGELRAKGKNEKDKLWRIGIDKPKDDNEMPGEDLQEIITVDNTSVSTSGNYRAFYIENGVKYSHTIDPVTGYPARNTILSATVVTPECADADGIATALMVMGLEKSKLFLQQNPKLKVLLIYSDKQGKFAEFETENFKPLLSH